MLEPDKLLEMAERIVPVVTAVFSIKLAIKVLIHTVGSIDDIPIFELKKIIRSRKPKKSENTPRRFSDVGMFSNDVEIPENLYTGGDSSE